MRRLSVFFISCFLTLSAWGSEAAMHFEQHIRPVLVEHCYKCHSTESGKQKGGLLVDSKQALLVGGDTGPAIVPGDLDKSLLIEAIRYTNRDLQMPEKKQLPQTVVKQFEKWVLDGAFDPREQKQKVVRKDRMKDGRRDYWSFQPMKKLAVPKVKDTAWPKTKIDHFILSKLEDQNYKPTQKAKPHNLLRRLSLDLVGLPPKLEDLEAFEKNPSREVYENLVDEYLNSNQYGVKWSRFWLDMARYSETAGGGRSYPVPSAWRYRNYVIDALNADMSYKQFITEQIAGDLLPFKNKEEQSRQMIATGFMVIGAKPLDLADKTRLSYDHIDEQIDTLGKVTMAMTLGCARCHDHRFDPVTEKDYYRMAAIFSNTTSIQHKLISRFTDRALPGADKSIAEKADKNTDTFRNILTKISNEEKKIQAGSKNTKKREELKRELEQLVQEDSLMPKALAMSEPASMKPAHLLLRGQSSRKGAEIERSAPKELVPFLQPKEVDSKISGRLELAEWITHRDNPLTARVLVNRIWAQLMGRGLVASLDNFGTTGNAPTHPGLLDHLALSFIQEGWSLKTLIKNIVLSAVYQQSTQKNLETNKDIDLNDPENALLSYYPQRRLSAESIRDSILWISGELDTKHIEGVLPNDSLQTSVYRSVYLPSLREEGRNHLLDVFDFPDAAASIGERTSTNLPSQALYLKNSPFMIEQSNIAAKRLLEDNEHLNRKEKLDYIARKFYSRSLTQNEEQLYLQFLEGEQSEQNAWTIIYHTMFCSLDFRFLK